MGIPPWQTILKDAGHLWYTGRLDVHWQNGNVGRLVCQGKQVPVSKESRGYIKEWTLSKRSIEFAVSRDTIDINTATVIEIEFTHGIPDGKHGCRPHNYSRLKEKMFNL
jgi:hypothetical protein